MKTTILVLLLVSIIGVPNRADGKTSEPRYFLQNRHSEPVNVEFVSPSGKILETRTVKKNEEIPIRASRRIVIRTTERSLEYYLPSVLDGPRHRNGPGQKYESMIDGDWRIIVRKAVTLGIEFIRGGTVERVPDFSKPPLSFPLRPRKSAEAFEEYKNNLSAQTREANHE